MSEAIKSFLAATLNCPRNEYISRQTCLERQRANGICASAVCAVGQPIMNKHNELKMSLSRGRQPNNKPIKTEGKK